jgi:hypothetical protein
MRDKILLLNVLSVVIGNPYDFWVMLVHLDEGNLDNSPIFRDELRGIIV